VPSATDSDTYLDFALWNVAVDGNSDDLFWGINPLPTYHELANASRGLGSLSVKMDRDGVLRRVPLIVRSGGTYYPLLPLRVACDYLGVLPQGIVVKPGKAIILKNATRPGENNPHDISIPIDRKGNMIVNFLGTWGSMVHYGFADVLTASDDQDELEIWREEMSGKIVIISDVSTGSTDIGPVPTDSNFPLSGVHSNIINSILTESFLRELSVWQSIGLEMLLMAAVASLSLRSSSVFFTFGTIAVGCVFASVVVMAFMYGQLLLPIVRPLLIIAISVVLIVTYRYIHEEKEKLKSIRQRDFIRDIFGRYLSTEVVEDLLSSPDGLKLSGEVREVTFVVSDLRGFTALTSMLEPDRVIEIINRYFGEMVEIIARYRGTVSEFQGDGILVFFGAPLQADDDALRAVACAIEMQNALAKVNAEQRQLNFPELVMGIGINTGEVVVGNIGSERRAKYGAVGQTINLAYRVESYTTGGQILISPGTYQKVQTEVVVRDIQEAQFKGIDKPLKLYSIAAIDGAYQVSLPEKEKERYVRLNPPLAVECFPLTGKTVAAEAIAGDMVALAKNSAEVNLDKELDIHTNLMLRLSPPEHEKILEAYAKVVPAEMDEAATPCHKVCLEFTWLPEELKQFLA
jgi:adenylate cyclase